MDSSSQWSAAYFLAKNVFETWKSENGSIDDFPKVASSFLSDAKYASLFDTTMILDECLTMGRDEGEFQTNSNFSDLPLNLFANDQIIVQALFWMTATTSIHNHTFTGAFKVLQGSSIHCVYKVKNWEEDSSSFSQCQLAVENAEYLSAGSVREIPSDMGLVHSVFHLEQPTITLLVVLNSELINAKQYEFRGFDCAVSQQFIPQYLVRKIQALKIAYHLDFDKFTNAICKGLKNASRTETYWLIRGLDGLLARLPTEKFQKVRQELSALPWGEVIFNAINCEKLVAKLVQLRARTTCVHTRIALALVANVPGQSNWGNVLQQMFSNDQELLDFFDEAMDSLSTMGSSISELERGELVEYLNYAKAKIFKSECKTDMQEIDITKNLFFNTFNLSQQQIFKGL